jgi:glucosamine--fructose-6-phosphate aminotransferase (isomerizing)
MAVESRAEPPGAEATLMFREAASSGAVLRAQFQRNDATLLALGETLRRLGPRALVTCARGSSDHAATFAKYLVETRTGVLVSSSAPSVSSIYLARQDLRGCVFLVISQSGRSPDLLASAQQARTAGATVVALVNSEDSPLAGIAQHTIPLCAGEEKSVAATKSFIASLAAVVHLVGAWSNDTALLDALRAAPGLLEQAWALDWSAALPVLLPASNLYVIGRGLGLGIAQEAALKCKETCGLHAEGFSSAEVLHGPAALLGPRFPAPVLAQGADTHEGVAALAAELAAREVPGLAAGAPNPIYRFLPEVRKRVVAIESTSACPAWAAALGW